MTSERRYRIIGDIRVKSKTPPSGRKRERNVEISYINERTTDLDSIAIIQPRRLLTPDTPYFFLEVKECDPKGIISIGIAPIDIDRHTGLCNNSLGYHSDTGRVYSSWRAQANTLGLQYGKGDTVGIYVTYFGENLSTVLIYYNNFPIATRYHFEGNKEQYYPTITFSNGHADVFITWPNAVDKLPSIDAIPISQWIRAPMSTYDATNGIFENPSKVEDLPIQSPTPLSRTFPYFVVTQQEVSTSEGKGASVGLATCSPLKPTPTCSLMKDYYTWFAKMRTKVGNMIGWGIYYDEHCQDDKAEQLCLVFVMFNKVIVDSLFVLQPAGGFVPIVLLQPYATKVSIERRDILMANETKKLQELYLQKLGPAMMVYEKDREDRDLPNELFRKSDQVLLNITDHSCRVIVPRTENSVHYVQFCEPLTSSHRFFFVELTNISPQSQVIIGIASSDHQLNDPPGMDRDTVGYNSQTGKMYTNRKDTGNMYGHQCRKGDTMGVEIEIFSEGRSVVLFSKNFRPIGTRYLTLEDHSEYLPTILIESYGNPVELTVYWHTRVSFPPPYSLRNPEDWCLPSGTNVNLKEKTFILPEHFDYSLCIQAPCCLNKKNNHFEIVLTDPFTDHDPPPAIALCTASPVDPPPTSHFRQDYLRFWPTGDAAKYLKQGDKIGWGILFPEEEDGLIGEKKEQLIICFLTVNRRVGYVQVIFQPIGGFYPVIIAPPNVNRIQMDFTAMRISTEDFTPEKVKAMLDDARVQILQEDPSINAVQATDDPPTNGYYPTSHDVNPTAYYDYHQSDPSITTRRKSITAAPVRPTTATTPAPVQSNTCAIL